MNMVQGKARQKLKGKIRSMKHQKAKGWLSEVEKMKLKDLENKLKMKA